MAGGNGPSLTVNDAQPDAAGNYYVEVLNEAGQATSSNALLTVNVPPSIDTEPQAQSVMLSSNATFTVGASGTAPLAYQWQFNSVTIPNATDSSYTRLNVQTSDAGEYLVIVTNVAGSATSSPTPLAVSLPERARFEQVSRLPDGSIHLLWSGEPGWSYTLEAATNLDALNWTVLGPISGSNGWFDFVDQDATNAPQRFYRARQ